MTLARLTAALVLFAAPAAMAEDLVFAFHNQTDLVVTEFYASPTDVGEWEEDILGADVLGSGESLEITIADGRSQCDYDLRTVFSDGQVIEEAVNLCELGAYTVHN